MKIDPPKFRVGKGHILSVKPRRLRVLRNRPYRVHVRATSRNFRRYLAKMRGEVVELARPNYRYVLWSWLGAFIAIAATSYSSTIAHAPMLIAPFGATCVLAFAVPDSPLAQPRNIVGGHCLAALIGLVLLHTFGHDAWVMALAVSTTIGLMQLTHTLHPPAGATPLVILTSSASWKFFFAPVLTGSLLLVLCAVVFNNLAHDRSYPKYWM